MEVIKIIFFALGTFFGVEDSTIMAEETAVHIDIAEQIITVDQRDVFALVSNEKDSLKIRNTLYRIGNSQAQEKRLTLKEKFDTYAWSTSEIVSRKETKQLDIKLKCKYVSKEQLKDFGIDYVEKDSSYAMINIPAWNIKTTTGALRDNYWYFKDSISFTLSPAKDMPKKYLPLKKGLYNYWEQVKP